MPKCDVDIEHIEQFADVLKRWASVPLDFIDQSLIDKKISIQGQSQGVITDANKKIALIEAENIALTASLPAAQAADLAAMAAGEEANAVQEIELKIAVNESRINRLHNIVESIQDQVCDRVEMAMTNYLAVAQRREDEYCSRFKEVATVLVDYVVDMTNGKSELLGSSTGACAISLGTGALAASDLEACGPVAEDMATILFAENGPREELAIFGADYASVIANEAQAFEIDALKSHGEEPGFVHRHPIHFGDWADALGNSVDPSIDINRGTFYWTPDYSHVFGGERNNPKGLSGGEIARKYGFESLVYKDGYPVFPGSSIMATVSLDGVLSTERPKNFDDAALLLIATRGEGQKPEFRKMVSNFMRIYPNSDGWFTTRSQVKKFIKVHRLTWHESEDMRDIYLIPREVHSMALHDGGVSNAKYRDRIESEFRLLAKAALEEMLSGD